MSRYVRTVPLVRMPRSLGFFDYALPDGMDAEVGELVSVPFRGRTLPALVTERLSSTDVPAARIKEVRDVIDAPPLGAPVVAALLELAETSLTSPATAVHALLPTVPKRPVPQEHAASSWAPSGPDRLPPLWHEALEKPGSGLLAYDAPDDRRLFLEAALAHAHATGRPLIYVAPRVAEAESFADVIDGAAVVTGEGAMGARWRSWMAAASAPVVAGTALALFTPHSRPAIVVVDEEEASEHVRSDAAPRFDVRRAAERVAAGWDCPLVFLSRAPSVALYARLGKDVRLIPKERPLRVRTVICDFGDEFRSKRFRPVTEAFLTGLERVIGEGRRAVVIVNRKGDAARLVCRDCRLVASCGNCGAPLAVRGERLVCPRCRDEEAVPDLCPSCGGTRLAGSGAGIDAIAAFLAGRFPEARIRTFTKESHAEADLEADIVLGTEYLMSRAYGRLAADRGLGFVGTLSADTFLLRLSDPTAPEREYQRLRRLALLAAVHEAPLHLQTSEPELPLYAMLAAEPESWYRLELEDRRGASLHPYSGQARLVASGKDHDKLKDEAERLARRLKGSDAYVIHEVRIVRSGRMSKAWIGLTFPSGEDARMRLALAGALPEDWGLDPAASHPIT